MHLKLKISFLIIYLLSIFGAHAAGLKKRDPAKEIYDTSKVVLRSFSADSLTKYKKDKSFDYSGTSAAYRETFWERFWGWVWERIVQAINSVPNGGKIVQYVLLLVGTGFLVYFILRASGLDVARFWQKGPAKADVTFSESLENIHEINFDSEIDKAVLQHNYRLAVRLLYLKSLKQLNDLRLINWQSDKTNSAYLLELTEPSQKRSFGVLTRQFEYVWYGDFPIDETAYSNIYRLFTEFKKQLQ